METILAIATCLLAVVTIFLAYYTSGVFRATLKLANESREASIRQIGVQTWLEFSKRFDSKELLKARDDLALQVRIVPAHGKKLVSDILVSFFEDLGTVYRLGYIDEKLARDTFGYHVRRWWAFWSHISNMKEKSTMGTIPCFVILKNWRPLLTTD